MEEQNKQLLKSLFFSQLDSYFLCSLFFFKKNLIVFRRSSIKQTYLVKGI